MVECPGKYCAVGQYVQGEGGHSAWGEILPSRLRLRSTCVYVYKYNLC